MKTQIVKIANIVAAVLIIVSIVLTFMPYWHYVGTETVVSEETGKKVKVEVEKDASLTGYIWMIDNHKELTKIFDGIAKPVYAEEYEIEKAELQKIADEKERADALKNHKKKTAFDTNEIIATVVLLMVIGVVALIFIIRNLDSLFAPFLCVGFGYVSITGFLANNLAGSIYALGNTWVKPMYFAILGGIVAVCAVVSFAFNLPAFVKKLKGSY